MYSESLVSPFTNIEISKYLDTINSKYFNTNRFVFAQALNQGFVSEVVLSLKKNPITEDCVLLWLLRIQRYFLIDSANTSSSSKANTVVLLEGFLRQFVTLPTDVRNYLCAHPGALNCLVFTLLLTKDKDLWISVLGKIKDAKANSAIILLLEWAFKYYFNPATASCEPVLAELTASDIKTYETDFMLPKSPLSTVFRFVAFSQWYEKNPKELPGAQLMSIFPRGEIKNNLALMPYVIEQGVCAQILTNNLPHLVKHLVAWDKSFKAGFRVHFMDKRVEHPGFYTDRFRVFLHGYIQFSLNRMDKNSVLELVGLSYLIKFYAPKPYGYHDLIIAKGVDLVRYLFDKKQYQEAYELYDELTAFYTEYETEAVKKAKIAVYCYFAKVGCWLQNKDRRPKFNPQELVLLESMPKLHEVLKNELASFGFYEFATRLAKKYQSNSDELEKNLYQYYYAKITAFLTKNQYEHLSAFFANTQRKPKEKTKGLVVPSTQVIVDSPPESGPLLDSEYSTFVKLEPAQEAKSDDTDYATRVVKNECSAVDSGYEPAFTSVRREESILCEKALEPLLTSIERPKPTTINSVPTFWSTETALFQPLVEDLYVLKSQPNATVTVSLPQESCQTTFIKEVTVNTAALTKEIVSTTIEKYESTATNSKSKICLGEVKQTVLTKIPQRMFYAPPSQPVKSPSISIPRDKIPGVLLDLIAKLNKQFPKTRFYLTGAAPANVLAQIKPNDYDIIAINSNLQALFDFVQATQLKSQLRSNRSPILYCELGQGITIDISVKNPIADESVNKVLKRDFEQRDFSLNALYCELTQDLELEIFSFDTAISMRNQKVIQNIKSAKILFKEDPCRLFRLIKLLITYPDFTVAPDLQAEIDKLQGVWIILLQNWRDTSEGNPERLDQAMKKLFDRFSYQQINTALDKLGLLHEFTSNSLEAANRACNIIPAGYFANRLLYWVSANLLMAAKSKEIGMATPIKQSLLLSNEEQDFLAFISARAIHQKYHLTYFLPEALGIVKAFAAAKPTSNGFMKAGLFKSYYPAFELGTEFGLNNSSSVMFKE